MIHHLVLFKLKPEVDSEKLDTILRQTRAQLLKIGDVLTLRCGKNLDSKSDWGFFLSFEVENTDKLALLCENAIFIKYQERILKPNTEDEIKLTFETEPGRDINFS
jgi:hypothetical protein